MNATHPRPTGANLTYPWAPLSCAALCALLLGNPLAQAADEAKGPSPAKVNGALQEADLATVVLTPAAEKRLAITTAAVLRKPMARLRLFGGEAIMPAHQGGEELREGQQSILAILPSLSPTDLIRVAEAQVDADGQVEQARVALEAAKVNFQRAEQLLRTKAGTERAVEDNRVLVQQAEAALRTAEAKRSLLAAPVLDVMNPKQLWVRVPVYVGDLDELDIAQAAHVGSLAGFSAPEALRAEPVAAPPSASAAAASVDLFYAVENAERKVRLGQKLGVQIPLRAAAESLVVPWSAIVFDFNGGAWVYECLKPQTYVGRRVQVRWVENGEAVLESGLAAGTLVATTGVAELFGTQFGVGK